MNPYELAFLVAATVGFGSWSLLAVLPTPSYLFWKPGVAATEWGHWLAIVVMVFASFLLGVDAPAWSIVISLVAAGLFLTPAVRAVGFAPRVGSLFDRAFPRPSATDNSPEYGQPREMVPFSVRRILHVPMPPIEVETRRYATPDDRPLLLDIYRPHGANVRSAPLIVFVHAGSWRSGDRGELAGLNRYLASRGIGVAALDYRLAPEHRFPAPVDDILEALEFLSSVAEEYACAPDRIVLAGRSAGGHLALSAAYRSDIGRRIRGVVALYAPTDLRWSWRHPAPRRFMDSNRVIRDFLGGTFDEIPEVFEAASPLLQVSARCPPTLLIHGRKDELVSPLQSSRLGDALSRSGVPHLHVELPWGNHAMEANVAGPSGQITTYLIERFLRRVTDASVGA